MNKPEKRSTPETANLPGQAANKELGNYYAIREDNARQNDAWANLVAGVAWELDMNRVLED